MLKMKLLENFLATGGFFEHNTYRIMVLGWLKKERRRWTILIFDRFRLVILEHVLLSLLL